MAMDTFPPKYPLPIYLQSIFDSPNSLVEALEGLNPLESDLMPGNSLPPSACDVAQDPAHQSSDRLNWDPFYPPVKRARFGEDGNFHDDTVLDMEHVPGVTFHPSTSETGSQNPTFDRLLNGYPAPCMGANVRKRLSVTGADDSAQRHGYEGLMNEKSSSGTEFHAFTDQVHSLSESGHRKYTNKNIKRDILITLEGVLAEDFQLKPKDARNVPFELIFPYFEQLKTRINSVYGDRISTKRQLIEKCGELPIATYGYRTSHSKTIFRAFNVITDATGKAVFRQKLIQRLYVLIRWFFYSHSSLLEYLNLNSEEKSKNYHQACSWFLAQLFEPKNGAQIFKAYPDEIEKINYEYDMAQSLLIKIISEYNVQKKSPTASIFLLECWYQETHPETWEKILCEEGSFKLLMRRLLTEKETVSKKNFQMHMEYGNLQTKHKCFNVNLIKQYTRHVNFQKHF